VKDGGRNDFFTRSWHNRPELKSLEAPMDPFSLLTSAAAGLSLSTSVTAGIFGITAVSIGMAVVNLMNGNPMKSIKYVSGGGAFVAVLWIFGWVSGALGVI
jgi:hypothetical protein